MFENTGVLHQPGKSESVWGVPVGGRETEKGDVEMIKPFISPYSLSVSIISSTDFPSSSMYLTIE